MAEVVDPYLQTGSATGATFFEEQRALQGGAGTFYARTIDDPETDRLKAITRWALAGGGLGETPAISILTGMLAGAAARVLTERVNDTVLGNAEEDTGGRWFYQRVPRATCCAFCGMLASRGPVYRSEASAGMVVGSGVEIPPAGTKRKRGGQAGGIKPRGSQRLGETYHDNCYCTVVPVKQGNGVLFSGGGDQQWFDAYQSAEDEVRGSVSRKWTTSRAADGSLIKSWSWVDDKGVEFAKSEYANKVINAMRRNMYAASH